MNYFFHDQIRHYIVGFGSLFTDIHIKHTDPYGGPTQDIRIPLRWGAKGKFYTDYMQNLESVKRPYRIMLPAMYFVMTGMSADPSTMNIPVVKYEHEDTNDPSYVKYCFTPVPYNFQIAMGLWVKNDVDGHQIIEQILPMFRPYYNMQIKELTEMGIVNRSVPVLLNDCSLDLQNDLTEDASSLRLIQWNLSFTIKGRLYPAIKDSAIIKWAQTHLGLLDPYSGEPLTDNPVYEQLDAVDPYSAGYDEYWQVREVRTEDGDSSTFYFPKDTV